AKYDIEGSLAHAKMLTEIGILSDEDLQDIIQGLETIITEIQENRFEWSLDLEDVHLNVEKRLVDLIGDAGKRLHTGRSRNDQVATDIRLWLRDQIDVIQGYLKQLQLGLAELALEHADTIMHGFTYLLVDQSVILCHMLLAFLEIIKCT